MVSLALVEIGGGSTTAGAGFLTMKAGVSTLVIPGIGEVTFVVAELVGLASVVTGTLVAGHGTYMLNMATENQDTQNGYREVPQKGGGKNAPHANQKAKQSAREKYESVKQEYETLKSKPNKTKDDKKLLEKLESQKIICRNRQKRQEKIIAKKRKEVMDKPDNIYSFVVNYDAGTFVSQVKASSLEDALEKWKKIELPIIISLTKISKRLAIAIEKKLNTETPVLLKGLKNVWCNDFGLGKDGYFSMTIIKSYWGSVSE